jgi:hypothetical protein
MHLVFFVVIFRSEGTTGTMTAVPYSAMVASGAIWVTYGFLASDATIWLPNVRTLLRPFSKFRTVPYINA